VPSAASEMLPRSNTFSTLRYLPGNLRSYYLFTVHQLVVTTLSGRWRGRPDIGSELRCAIGLVLQYIFASCGAAGGEASPEDTRLRAAPLN
jgi:hypothetical protein